MNQLGVIEGTPIQHGAAFSLANAQGEIELHYIIGDHDTCDDFAAALEARPDLVAMRGQCMNLCLN